MCIASVANSSDQTGTKQGQNAQSVTANRIRQCQVCQHTSNSQNLAQSSAIGSALNPEPIAVRSLASLITVQLDT